MRYELPWPPSVNKYWMRANIRKKGGGTRPGMILTPKARAYRLKVWAALGIGRQPLTGRISLEIELYPPDRRRRDIDNYNKAILDALAYAQVYKDDSQIKRKLVAMKEPVKDGKVIVDLVEIR